MQFELANCFGRAKSTSMEFNPGFSVTSAKTSRKRSSVSGRWTDSREADQSAQYDTVSKGDRPPIPSVQQLPSELFEDKTEDSRRAQGLNQFSP